jgi:hypothetical protein
MQIVMQVFVIAIISLTISIMVVVSMGVIIYWIKESGKVIQRICRGSIKN